MSSFVLRRSILSLTSLAALLAAAGGILVWLGVPAWVPLVLAIVIVGIQYAINPWLIEHLIRADVVGRSSDRAGYDIEHPLGPIVARRCREANLRLVKLGIIDDGTPNAFTFGHTRRDARVWVSRGLLERLDDDELDAVISHEIGHVANNDFIVMTLAAVVPMLLYYVYLGARSARGRQSGPVMLGAYLGYVVAQLAVLALARARELGADHHSCAVTGNGDALASALVKIGYGMGQVDAERSARARDLRERAKGRDGSEKRAALKEAARVERAGNRMRAARALGIADPDQGAAMVVAYEEGTRPEEVLGALRWDACNPWARFQEKLSSHPIVVHRIAALERSGLPGAPTRWSAVRIEASGTGPELDAANRRFAAEVVLRYTGPAALVVCAITYFAHAWTGLAWALLAAGLGMFARTIYRDPLGAHAPVDRVTSLLERLDASPIRGIPVSVRGRVVGRGVPGYVLSPDLVVQDSSGFVPLIYREPLPFAREAFAVVRAGRYAEQEVLVRGWYRRGPSPSIELRDIKAADGTASRSHQWLATYALSAALLVAGLIAVAGALLASS